MILNTGSLCKISRSYQLVLSVDEERLVCEGEVCRIKEISYFVTPVFITKESCNNILVLNILVQF